MPLIAVHLFVFYFGLMADVTPPVGLASFAAAAIARTDPIKTGITAFLYSMRTAILPFLFIFNTQLLMIGITGPFHFALTVISAVVAMLVFAAATQGYFLVRNRWWETVALLLVTFTLFRPGFWWDMVYPPFQEVPAAQMGPLIEAAPAGASKRVWIAGTNIDGKDIRKGVLLPLGAPGTVRDRLVSLTICEQLSVCHARYTDLRDHAHSRLGFVRIKHLEAQRDNLVSLSLTVGTTDRAVRAFNAHRRAGGDAVDRRLVADQYDMLDRLADADGFYRGLLGVSASLASSMQALRASRIARWIAVHFWPALVVTSATTDLT